uniref:Putative ovule protein n=1 Tax=Solanum chacoense TaxID=4108 RepID=A0A0V0I3L4_SOLCH
MTFSILKAKSYHPTFKTGSGIMTTDLPPAFEDNGYNLYISHSHYVSSYKNTLLFCQQTSTTLCSSFDQLMLLLSRNISSPLPFC